MPDIEPNPSSSAPGRWRAYVTTGNGSQQVELDRVELDWAAGRVLLLERILPFLADSCECCREAAMECLYELDDPAAPGTEFLGEIDGEQYVLTASRAGRR
jgi:hypothetical protein